MDDNINDKLEEKGEAFEGSLETTLFDRLHYSLKRLLDENEVAQKG